MKMGGHGEAVASPNCYKNTKTLLYYQKAQLSCCGALNTIQAYTSAQRCYGFIKDRLLLFWVYSDQLPKNLLKRL